jgi:hypothetical protein
MVLKNQPSTWPKWPLVSFRFLQFLAVVVVFAITGYFNYYLLQDGYQIPWEFITLEFVAALTLFNIFSTAFLLCLGRLNFLALMIVDGVLSLCWALVFGILARAMGKTTFETCDVYNWGNSDGIRVCHMYKMLFAFTVLSWAFHLGSFSFASIMRSRQKKHAYAPAPNPANLRSQKSSYPSPNSGITYGSSAPPVYTTAPDYTAGKDAHYG